MDNGVRSIEVDVKCEVVFGSVLNRCGLVDVIVFGTMFRVGLQSDSPASFR